MSLNTEADYERLASHLNAIDPVVQPFSFRHGYTLLKWPMGGRYPNRKMHMHSGMVWKSIQVAMDVRPDGGRFDEFYPDIPIPSLLVLGWMTIRLASGGLLHTWPRIPSPFVS